MSITVNTPPIYAIKFFYRVGAGYVRGAHTRFEYPLNPEKPRTYTLRSNSGIPVLCKKGYHGCLILPGRADALVFSAPVATLVKLYPPFDIDDSKIAAQKLKIERELDAWQHLDITSTAGRRLCTRLNAAIYSLELPSPDVVPSPSAEVIVPSITRRMFGHVEHACLTGNISKEVLWRLANALHYNVRHLYGHCSFSERVELGQRFGQAFAQYLLGDDYEGLCAHNKDALRAYAAFEPPQGWNPLLRSALKMYYDTGGSWAVRDQIAKFCPSVFEQ